MSQNHEYALLGGYNRSHLGRWLGSIAAVVSGALVFLLLSAVDLAKALGWPVNVPPTILSLIGAGAVYGVLYWLFDRHIWKIGPIGRLLKLPDLSGKWVCVGQPLETGQATAWQGTMTIIQSWDRLRICLVTPQSRSNSVAAALLHDEVVGYRLMYHYQNQPVPGAVELAPHHGFAELTFAPGEASATGDYFNGRGRNTFGTMLLAREVA